VRISFPYSDDLGDVASVYDRASLIACSCHAQQYARHLTHTAASASVLLSRLNILMTPCRTTLSVEEPEVQALYENGYDIEAVCPRLPCRNPVSMIALAGWKKSLFAQAQGRPRALS